AYCRLYLAHLETRLFEGGAVAAAAGAEIQRLLASETWTDGEALGRAGLLAGWLAQDGGAIAEVIGRGTLSAASLSVGLGWQALLATPLSAASVLAASLVWALPGRQDAGPAPDLGIIQLN